MELKCQHEREEGYFCSKCGTRLNKCGHENQKGYFCIECGEMLEDVSICPECGQYEPVGRSVCLDKVAKAKSKLWQHLGKAVKFFNICETVMLAIGVIAFSHFYAELVGWMGIPNQIQVPCMAAFLGLGLILIILPWEILKKIKRKKAKVEYLDTHPQEREILGAV